MSMAVTGRARLERMTRQTQAEGRIPALSVALHRADRPLWTLQVGAAGTDRPLDVDTLFRMGSVTKTFTAVLVMQCRDEGLIDLDDPLGRHLPVPAHGDLTIRRLLSHTAGLQREAYGDVWDTLEMPDAGRLVEDLVRVERVLPTGRRFHYSNLGFTLLGLMVARLRGGTWAEVLAERILRPLDLGGVAVDPGERAAVGYLVDAYSDHARPEPPTDFDSLAPAGQLWGTAADLARWAAFLVDPATIDPKGAVLPESTLDEMRFPLTVTDEDIWMVGLGLGLMVFPRAERATHVGHDGAMPGFLAGAYGRHGGTGTPRAYAAAALGSSGTGVAAIEFVHALLDAAVEEDPTDVEPWAPGEAPPEEYRSALGPWWSEGFEFVFTWQSGRLRARRAGDPPRRPPSVFELLPDGDLRTVSGREAGERLRLDRDPATGEVRRMHWATYRFTRVQETFDGVPPSEP